MSALPPEADILQRGSHVRYVPKADIQRVRYQGAALKGRRILC
jgi:hypothetical protein